MTVHLTDDEILATCGLLGLSWPFPLPTVESEAGGVAAAARRGVRSLTVRALLGVDEQSNAPGLNAEVAQAVSSIANGSPVLVSGVIDDQGALRPTGSAAFVVRAPDGAGVLSTTTSTGIHVISTSTIAEAREAFIALVDNALTSGLAGSDLARLLVLKTGESDRALAVMKGSVTVGRIGDASVFEGAGPAATDWDRNRLDQHLAA